MAHGEDTEITLGMGKLLGMFFALVVICAVFFGLGYSLGRGSAKEVATNPEAAAPQAVPATGAPKPTAAKGAEQPKTDTDAPSTSDELTFYKSVEQKDATPQLPANAPAQPAAAAPAPATPSPELTKPAPGTFVLQVAAVTKQEDAENLKSALLKKQYPVFITSTDADKLFHVQVGPFTDLKEAEAMKTKLAGEGFSPILKR
jgi:cell division septation protein DedD